ncbi:porin [Vibrio breoganii]|uniref:Porin n=1 Tax=Vibrio breoganii TaxID=553239 RepID=A0AAN0XU87_9VIBR|nr:porin [Vibrio breoganii]ANO32619.1 porin [Vibrio breoganii]PMK29101.1 porin [Vibrio breoganii]PMK41325.1 porin [Vibrio breoganii]PML02869.1 porin [Vibrio breoganii]PML09334.1 porin [Vibrio breoganii]
MKKTLLALAVASVAATSVNAAEIYKSDDGSVDFYGQLRQELKFLDGNDHDATLSSGSSRTGVKGQYAITDSVDVVGLVELGIRDNTDVNVRQHYVGFAGDFGTIKFGKQWTTSDDVYGADYSYFFGGSALRYSTLNGAQHESQIKYNIDFDSFWVKAGWGLNDSDSENDLYELFVGGNVGDLALHAGAGYTGETAGTATNGFELENTYAEFTAEYGLGDHLIGFTYYWAELANQNGSEKIDESGISLAGIFQMMEKTALYAGYEYTMQDASGFVGDNGDEDGTLIYVGVEHKFNSWARVYGEYGYGDGTTLGYNNQGSDSQVAPTMADGESNFAVGARFYW